MRRIKVSFLYLILIILLFSGCDDRNPTDAIYSLTVTSDLDTLYTGSVINSCEIQATLTKWGQAVEDAQIDFCSNIGLIPASVTTNIEGIATATFRYDSAETGSAVIRASYDDLNSEVVIHIIEDTSHHITLSSDCDTLFIGSEVHSCEIRAVLTEDSQPVEGAQINFTTDKGQIPTDALTNNEGLAEVTFVYEGTETGPATIRASYNGVYNEKMIQIIIDPGYSLAVNCDPDTLILGSSMNYSQIRAELTLYGQPVEGVQINFETNIGNIFANAVTNISGIAEVIFWYDGTATGTAIVRALFSGLEDEVQIYIVEPPVIFLEVWASPDIIYLESGNYSTDVFARLTDEFGIGMENEIITFTASGGSINSTAVTNSDGYAQVIYVYSGNVAQTIVINANYQGQTALNYINIVEPAILLTVTADPDTIYQGTSINYSEIYAHLSNEFGAPIADVTINFSANPGSILTWAVTNNLGIAHTTFWYNDRPDITATITASYQGIIANTTVIILENQPQIVFLEADPLIIYADNDPETYSVITTRVVDSAGSPEEGLTVTFETTIGYMDQPSAVTNHSGYATSLLQDNGIHGLATVFVYCENDQSQIDVQILEIEPPRGK